jgi:hypothetical protein
MKIRVMFKRIVQPPIDTPASIDCLSEVFEISDTLARFLTGKDRRGCGVSFDVAGVEVIEETDQEQL